jgi:hypothetical protein
MLLSEHVRSRQYEGEIDRYERDTYRGKADLFAIYNPVLDVVYLVDVEEAPEIGMHIRWADTENNQATRVNWHADYVLDARLEGL